MDEKVKGRWPSLIVLTLVYVVGELSHFLLGIVTRPMSQDIGYGIKECLTNTQLNGQDLHQNVECYTANNSLSCEELGSSPNSNASFCIWDYSGLGIQYQLLAGPAFIAVFTISGIFIGMISDRFNRRTVVTLCLALLTLSTTLMGGANAYWHLVILRMAVGAGESAFSPACSSMISDMFDPSRRGLALGIFNWGIYFGYGLSYAIGNFITKADIAGMGWRWSYFVTGGIGLVVFVLLVVVVKEPERKATESSGANVGGEGVVEYSLKSQDRRSSEMSVTSSDLIVKDEAKKSCCQSIMEGESGLKQVFKHICTAPLIMLTIAACVRHTAGFTWAYNTQLYFTTYYPSYNLGIWITAISIVGGTLGVASGGFISDKLVSRIGLRARIYVLAASQFIATPFAVGVLYFSPPVAFYCLLGSYLFAEMWFGVLFAVILELIPPRVQSTSIAIFLFIINNVGGNAPILVEPIRNSLSYQLALLIMYPGFYLISSALFFLASFFVAKEQKVI